MKAVVTAWQIRDDDGDQRLNDHADADYDAGVLARLDELQVDVGSWLASWGGASRPMRAYGSRLAAAAELARNGDHRFLASPRVDSYHSAWFELHEDLIRLAGRTRDDVPDA
jgi:pyruvate,orthophosphate dikinase